jgi:hypothetical protein
LNRRQRASAICVPWTFVAVYAVVYATLLLPRAHDGFGVVVSALVGVIWLVFAVAAVTFSRDVVTGRWAA